MIVFFQRFTVDTFVEFSTEQLEAHDAEDEPKDKTNKHHVDDRRNRVHQGIDDNL